MNVSPAIVRFTCPACEQPIESPGPDARAGVKCPGCGTGFVPDRLQEVEPEQPSVSYHSMKLGKLPGPKPPSPEFKTFRKVERIEANADRLSSLSFVCFGIALIIVIGAGCSAMEYEGSLSMEHRGLSMIAISAAAGFLTIGLLLQVLAQLLHIRTALERRG